MTAVTKSRISLETAGIADRMRLHLQLARRLFASLLIVFGLSLTVSLSVGVDQAEAQNRKFSSGGAAKVRSAQRGSRTKGARRSGVQLGAGARVSGRVSGQAVYSRRAASRIIGLSNTNRNFKKNRRGGLRNGSANRGGTRSGVVLGGKNYSNRYYNRQLGDRSLVRLNNNRFAKRKFRNNRAGINRYGRAGNIQRIGPRNRNLPKVISPTVNETFVDNSQQVIVVPGLGNPGGNVAAADAGEYGELPYNSCPSGFSCTVRGAISGNGPKIITLEKDPEVIRYEEHKPVK